jgi:hypothetical protein
LKQERGFEVRYEKKRELSLWKWVSCPARAGTHEIPAPRAPYRYFSGFRRAERIYRLIFIQNARTK